MNQPSGGISTVANKPDSRSDNAIFEPDPGSNRFSIGAFDRRITLMDQQTRALNLIYQLNSYRKLRRNTTVAVIGAGAAGLTAAVAADWLRAKVSLFDERPLPLDLQVGCDTRWVHPNLANWPDDVSTLPYAGLPFLNWREASAGEVAQQITEQFKEYHDQSFSKITFNPHTKATASGRVVTWHNHKTNKTDSSDFEIIIFAIGFGTEQYTDRDYIQSYWRNDSLHQSETNVLRGKKSCLISGVGDGGLTDLARACILSYHQGRLVRELFPPDNRALYFALKRLKKNWVIEFGEQDNLYISDTPWLWAQYEELFKKEDLQPIIDEIKDRSRTDCEVTLNGKDRNIKNALSLKRASMLNTFIAYLLYKSKRFSYSGGEIDLEDEHHVKIGSKTERFDHIVMRHGTDREQVKKDAEFLEAITDNLDISSDKRFTKSDPIWPVGWWHEERRSDNPKKEFVSPAARMIATTFVSTISDVVLDLHSSGHEMTDYRITLHRVMRYRDEYYFQQVCRYFGTRTKGAAGRVFALDKVLVGYSCLTGLPLLIDNTSGINLDSDMSKGIDDLRTNNPMKTVFTCPFFTADRESKARSVNLILFIDSDIPRFFDKHSHVMKTIYATCRGFVKNVEQMVTNNEIYFPYQEYRGYDFDLSEATSGKYDDYILKNENKDIFENHREDFMFKKFFLFDPDLTPYQAV